VYNVETSDEYQIAKFDKDVVLNELRRGQPTPLRQLFKFSRKGFRRNILGQTMYFLLAYVFLHTLVQLAYQKNWFCSNEERPNEKNEKNETITPHKRCIARATAYFVHWDENARTLTSLITFLLGFYVTTIARRWWEQVSKLPDADNIVLILGGLVWTDSKPEAALKFKKTIIRYALLSWTMCLSQISSPLRHKFLTDEKYIEKGLLTKEEAIALKIDPNDPDCTSQWWIPISWAIAMVNKTFNEKEKTDILIPKDHKDVVSVLIKFRENLNLIAEYTLRPLPAIYKQGYNKIYFHYSSAVNPGSLVCCFWVDADGSVSQPEYNSPQRCRKRRITHGDDHSSWLSCLWDTHVYADFWLVKSCKHSQQSMGKG